MRLTCPNCGARYEIDDALIPEEGRDVQCSNCSTNWFQSGPVVATSRAETPPTVERPNPPETSTPPRRELDPSLRALLREKRRKNGCAAKKRRLWSDKMKWRCKILPPHPPAARAKIAWAAPDIEEINASLTPQHPTATLENGTQETPAAKSAPSPDHARRKGRNAGLC